MGDAVVSVRSVGFAWPGAATDCLGVESLEVLAGERVFLAGGSGSGKSTLLSLVAGVLLPQRGRVELLGRDLAAMRAGRRDRYRAAHVGFVFQLFNLVPYLSVVENIVLPCRFSRERAGRVAAAGTTPREQAGRLMRALELPAALADRPAAQLSVGQQQRVAAARALIGSPELLIADEPTSALDAGLQRVFVELLLAEARAAGAAILFVSHDLRLAEGFDRTLRMAELNRAAGGGAA